MKTAIHNVNDTDHKAKPPREWLLMQAQLQLEYASAKDAEVLLELVEALYGESISSSLMLCKAWALLQQKEKLEKKSRVLLANSSLSQQQTAAIYSCLSKVRWQASEPKGARQAHNLYKSSISQEQLSA